MIVKFSKHGKGKASGVLDYLLKEKGSKGTLVPRSHAKVLYGDPVLTEHLINTTSHKTKYKSGYLSFSERALFICFANLISTFTKIQVS